MSTASRQGEQRTEPALSGADFPAFPELAMAAFQTPHSERLELMKSTPWKYRNEQDDSPHGIGVMRGRDTANSEQNEHTYRSRRAGPAADG